MSCDKQWKDSSKWPLASKMIFTPNTRAAHPLQKCFQTLFDRLNLLLIFCSPALNPLTSQTFRCLKQSSESKSCSLSSHWWLSDYRGGGDLVRNNEMNNEVWNIYLESRLHGDNDGDDLERELELPAGGVFRAYSDRIQSSSPGAYFTLTSLSLSPLMMVWWSVKWAVSVFGYTANRSTGLLTTAASAIILKSNVPAEQWMHFASSISFYCDLRSGPEPFGCSTPLQSFKVFFIIRRFNFYHNFNSWQLINIRESLRDFHHRSH